NAVCSCSVTRTSYGQRRELPAVSSITRAPVWRKGRLDRLKLGCPQGRVGSTPTTGKTLSGPEVLVANGFGLGCFELARFHRPGVEEGFRLRDVLGRARRCARPVVVGLRNDTAAPMCATRDATPSRDEVHERREERHEHEEDDPDRLPPATEL